LDKLRKSVISRQSVGGTGFRNRLLPAVLSYGPSGNSEPFAKSSGNRFPPGDLAGECRCGVHKGECRKAANGARQNCGAVERRIGISASAAKKAMDRVAHGNVCKAVLAARGALAAEMDHLRGGGMEYFPSVAMDAMAQVDFFGVHKIFRIETADLFKHMSTYEDACAGDDVHVINRFVVAGGAECSNSPRRRSRPAAFEKIESQQLIEHGREALHATGLHCAVGIDQPASNRACLGVGGQQIHHSRQRIAEDHGVGVEKEQVAAGRLLRGQIVGPSKAEVSFGKKQRDPGKLCDQPVAGCVRRGVIDDNYFVVQAMGIGADRCDALFRKREGIPIDENDGKVFHQIRDRPAW